MVSRIRDRAGVRQFLTRIGKGNDPEVRAAVGNGALPSCTPSPGCLA